MTSGVIGCFVLWLGWFGFNPGSTMAADPGAISHIFMTTNTAAFMALLSATALSWMLDGKPDLGMSVNGCLAGLVAITAPCAFVTVTGVAHHRRCSAGCIVVCAVKLLRQAEDRRSGRRRPGPPVQRRLRHALRRACSPSTRSPATATGNGLFNGGGDDPAHRAARGHRDRRRSYTLVASLVFWYAIKAVFGLRVSAAEEEEGLDIGEHGQVAYTGIGKLG